jgi:hypothetical protein
MITHLQPILFKQNLTPTVAKEEGYFRYTWDIYGALEAREKQQNHHPRKPCIAARFAKHEYFVDDRRIRQMIKVKPKSNFTPTVYL